MNRMLVSVLLASSTVGITQTPQIKAGATVYIEPDKGYETYLSAAIVTKHVPVVVVTDRDKAQYIIRSTVSDLQPNQSALIVNNNTNRGYNPGFDASFPSTSIAVVDVKSSAIVFAYSAGPAVLNRTADRCAQHLKEFIKKPRK